MRKKQLKKILRSSSPKRRRRRKENKKKERRDFNVDQDVRQRTISDEMTKRSGFVESELFLCSAALPASKSDCVRAEMTSSSAAAFSFS